MTDRERQRKCRKKKKAQMRVLKAKMKRIIATVDTDQKVQGIFDTAFVQYLELLEQPSMKTVVELVNKHVYVNQFTVRMNVNKHKKPKSQPQKWEINIDLPGTKEQVGAAESVPLPWFVVQKSTIPDANLGLFANRNFSHGDMIGIYLGKSVNNGNMVSHDYVIKSPQWGVIDARASFNGSPNPYYYMGLHIMNDPTLKTEKEGSEIQKEVRSSKRLKQKQVEEEKEHLEEQKQKVNVRIRSDLLTYVTRDIQKGEELFVEYQWNDKHQKVSS